MSAWEKWQIALAMTGSALAAIAGAGGIARYLFWPRVKETIDERIDQKLQPVWGRFIKVESRLTDLDGFPSEVGRFRESVDDLKISMREGLDKLADAIEGLRDENKELHSRITEQGQGLARMEGAIEGLPERRSGRERRRSQ